MLLIGDIVLLRLYNVLEGVDIDVLIDDCRFFWISGTGGGRVIDIDGDRARWENRE